MNEKKSVDTSTSPNSSASKTNKNLFIILGAVVGGLVILGVIAWAVYASLFAVSKEDYREAVRVGNDVVSDASRSYLDISKISYISSYSTETKTKNDIDSAKDSLAAYKTANAKFKDLKALRDGDVKKAYDEYTKKYNAFVTFADEYTKSAEKAIPAIISCEEISNASVSDVASFKAAVAPCKDALSSAKNVSDKDLKAFVAAYIDNVDKISAIVDEAANLSSTDFTRRSTLRSQLSDETKKLQDAQKDANSNIEKRLKDVSPREAYNDFGNVLEEKQRQ